MIYACDYLRDKGYIIVKDKQKADYILPPVTAKACDDELAYMAKEQFLVSNAYLTAEAAVCIAKDNSDISIIASPVMIVGYGRIGKALHKFLSTYTNDITVCARSSVDQSLARCNGAKVIGLADLKRNSCYSFVFNTVPHPVFNDTELVALGNGCLLVDLASFPGGVDKHLASVRGVKLVEARGLPGKFSPKTAGKIIADTVIEMIEEGRI